MDKVGVSREVIVATVVEHLTTNPMDMGSIMLSIGRSYFVDLVDF